MQNVQFLALGHALDCADLAALRLCAQNEARADEAAIDGDGTRAAIARAAAFFSAGQAEAVAQHVHQAFIRLAQKLDGIAVDGG